MGSAIKQKIKDFLRGEENKTKPEDVKYGIITRNDEKCGLFSFFITYLGGIKFCLDRHLIPIIDMQSYPNLYLKENQVGKKNAWEIFFEQPMEISLNQTKDNENLIIDVDQLIKKDDRPNLSMDFLTNEGAVQYWRNLCHKYIRFSTNMQFYIEDLERQIFGQNPGRKVGVLCRGTDYVGIQPYDHPVQPMVEDVIQKVLETKKRYECEYIFLATEDEAIYERFQEVFQKKLLFVPTKRLSGKSTGYLAEQMNAQKIDVVENGSDYLAAIYLLAQCECLIAGRTSGAIGALLMSKEYEYQYFWNLGRYGVDDEIAAEGKSFLF